MKERKRPVFADPYVLCDANGKRFDPHAGFTLLIQARTGAAIQIIGPNGPLILTAKPSALRILDQRRPHAQLTPDDDIDRMSAMAFAELFSALTGNTFQVVENDGTIFQCLFLPKQKAPSPSVPVPA